MARSDWSSCGPGRRPSGRWQAWSPWEGLDPQQSRTYTGPDSGVGAHYAWSGNKKVGSGTMEVIEAQQPSTVAIDLRFLKPFKSQAITRFDVQPAEGGAAVSVVGTEALTTSSVPVPGTPIPPRDVGVPVANS